MSATLRARVAGVELSYRFDGAPDAPVVMLAHSVLTDHTMWDAVAQRLAPSFRVLRYDTRGHGASSAPPPPYTMALLADEAVGLLDALRIARVHFVGTSIGGMVGQQLGARHGARLLSLTLANTTAVQGAPGAWDERAAVARAKGVAALAQPTLQRWFTDGFRERAPQEVARVGAMIERTSVDGFVGCAAALRDLDQLELLARIAVPTLVIAGAQDQAAPPALAAQIREAIAGARLVTLPAAHQCAVEVPDAFCEAWIAFMRSLPAPVPPSPNT
jgi:3-oxoadipate enol-lactonase